MDERLKERIRNSPPTWALASRLKDAYEIPRSEWEQVLRFEWDEESELISVQCNGSGAAWVRTGPTYGGDFPSPAAIAVPAGCHVVSVDREAVLKTKPDGQEFFCAKDRTKHWEEYLIRVLHARLREKGDDLPPVDKFLVSKD